LLSAVMFGAPRSAGHLNPFYLHHCDITTAAT
jgi:hypothetical protein